MYNSYSTGRKNKNTFTSLFTGPASQHTRLGTFKFKERKLGAELRPGGGVHGSGSWACGWINRTPTAAAHYLSGYTLTNIYNSNIFLNIKMIQMQNLLNFTNLYSLSKTLRFELIPQGKTVEHIHAKGLLNKDFERAENYTTIKKVIDEYHKWFIELCLHEAAIPAIENAFDIFNTKGDDVKTLLKNNNDKLRKHIAEIFSEGNEKEKWKTLFSEDLIKIELPEFILATYPESEAIEKLSILKSFSRFTTYFTGFHQNRQNIYSSEAIATAIGYRIVHENMPKHFANCNNFLNTASKFDIDFNEVLQNFGAELNLQTIAEIFTPEFFNKCLSQKGIEKYNTLLGGKITADGIKLRGMNELINLYRQQHGLKAKQLPTMTVLYKQILSDRDKQSAIPEELKDINEVNEIISKYFNVQFYNKDKNPEKENVIDGLQKLMQELQNDSFNLSQVYIRNNTAITDISQYLFDDWGIIGNAIKYAVYNHFNQNKKGKTLSKNDEKEIAKSLKRNFYSLAEIENNLSLYFEKEVKDERLKAKYKPGCIVNYFATFTCMAGEKAERKEIQVLNTFNEPYNNAQILLNTTFAPTDRLDKKQKDILKTMLDAAVNILHFIKPLSIKMGNKENENLEFDLAFYNPFNILLEQLEALIPVYNRVRNFATQKPYSEAKVKLNFENSQLLNGWDVNKETDNTCVLFKRKGNYYLGIMDKLTTGIFKKAPKTNSSNDYEKMFYKLLPGPNKMLPKVIFSDKWIKYFNPSETMLQNYEKGMHKKGNGFDS